MDNDTKHILRAILIQLWILTMIVAAILGLLWAHPAKAEVNPWPLKLVWNEGKGLMEAVRMDTDEVEFWMPRRQETNGSVMMQEPRVKIGTEFLAKLSSGGNLTIDLTQDWKTREIVFNTKDSEYKFTQEDLEKFLSGKSHVVTVKRK